MTRADRLPLVMLGATLPLLAVAHLGCAVGVGREGATGGATGNGTGGASVSTGGTASGGSGGPAGGGTGGAAVGGTGGTVGGTGGTGTGGARVTGTGGAPTTGTGGAGNNGGPAVLGPFTEDFEDGDLLLPHRWLSALYDPDGDMSQWATFTDGTGVARQGFASKETELVSGDYRWRDSYIEAKVKLLTPEPRAGVCVRYKSVRDKWCLYIENLAQETTQVTGQIELRMRSQLGSASTLPKVKAQDIGVVPVLGGWNTVRLEVHGNQFVATWNGVMVFTFTDTANLVDSGGIGIATMDGAMAEFDDVNAGPL